MISQRHTGHTLTQLGPNLGQNDITKETPRAFEPTKIMLSTQNPKSSLLKKSQAPSPN